MSYRPKPLNVSHVILSPELRDLAEDIAKNTHELWSEARLKEGWVWGTERRDDKKETPCLVDYDQLPESEKEFDRITSTGAIKYIVAKGFNILPPKDNLAAKEESNPEDLKIRAREFLKKGECLKAHDLLLTVSSLLPDDLEVEKDKAVALARLGMAQSALRSFEKILSKSKPSREIWGMIGRSNRTLFEQAKNEKEREYYLQKALEGYEQADRLLSGPWTLINCALLLLWMGKVSDAKDKAKKIIKLSKAEIPQEDQAWHEATLGIAHLILGEGERAKELYRAHVEEAKTMWGVLGTSRRTIQLLLKLKNPPCEMAVLKEVMAILRVPKVRCFYAPGQFEQKSIEANDIGIAVPLPGNSMKFSKEILSKNGQLHLLFPCAPAMFKKLILENNLHLNDLQWEKAFDDLISKANSIIVVGDNFQILDPTIYDYLDRLAFGLSVLKSMELETSVEVTGKPNLVSVATQNKSSIKALVFADAVNFSKLRHEHFPIFEKEVWGMVAQLLQEKKLTPDLSNTWGDGLYMVLNDLADTAGFVLALAEKISATDWSKRGLPVDIGLRIGVHAGPVYQGHNPLTNTVSFVGASVCRAARIEPITPAGQVFVSQEFAALLAGEHPHQFSFSYVGGLSMAKNYGTFPMYRLEAVRGQA